MRRTAWVSWSRSLRASVPLDVGAQYVGAQCIVLRGAQVSGMLGLGLGIRQHWPSRGLGMRWVHPAVLLALGIGGLLRGFGALGIGAMRPSCPLRVLAGSCAIGGMRALWSRVRQPALLAFTYGLLGVSCGLLRGIRHSAYWRLGSSRSSSLGIQALCFGWFGAYWGEGALWGRVRGSAYRWTPRVLLRPYRTVCFGAFGRLAHWALGSACPYGAAFAWSARCRS
jgi:hypothetical protein